MPYCSGFFYRSYNGKPEGYVFPVILLHGAGSSLMGWPLSLRHLPSQRIFALDLPGHGHSTLPSPHSMRSLVRCLHLFFEEMGFYHVVLVGNSLGAALALSFANAYPEQVVGVCALCCGDRFNIPEELLASLHEPADARKAIEIFSKAAFYSIFPQKERRKILAPMLKMSPDVLLSYFSLAGDFYFDSLPSVSKIPSMFIGGSSDQITPPSSLHRLGHSFNKSSVSVIIKGTGHMLVYEKTEEIRILISNFLVRVNKPVYV
jgi:pimeloyl-ACP methyl ester carboxylesterase